MIIRIKSRERSWEGLFLAFQYPVEIPGVSNINFLRTALNERNKFLEKDQISAKDFLSMVKEKAALVGLNNKLKTDLLTKVFLEVKKRETKFFKWLC